MAHTPGKWSFFVTLPNRPAYVIGGDNQPVCALAPKESQEEFEANGDLIAAAPRMFDYLVRRASEYDEDAQEILDSIEGAK
jgi:hypothetical protein